MDNLQVKVVDFEEKSVQEVEAQLLREHEEKTGDTQIEEPVTETVVLEATQEDPSPSFGDNDVLSYLKTKFNREVNSLDELFIEKPQPQEVLPEDVSAFLKFKRETGRGLEDFYRVNRDYTKESPEALIASYIRETNPDLDDEDISFEIASQFSYDEDIDDASDIKKKKLAFKKELAKANKYFEQQKEQYKAPLESRMEASIPAEDKEALESYKQYMSQLTLQQQDQAKKSEYFVNKTNELFSNDFKGFDFKIGEKEFTYKPGDADKIKNDQLDLSKFFNNFVDENGFIKDAKEYHKTIAVARTPDAFARFFYEQGKADAIDESAKQSKNIDMGSVRTTGQPLEKGGFKVTAMNNDHGSRLRIK
jgi:hypothetical protein